MSGRNDSCLFVCHSFPFLFLPVYTIDHQIQLITFQLQPLIVHTGSYMCLVSIYLILLYCFVLNLHLFRVLIDHRILTTLLFHFLFQPLRKPGLPSTCWVVINDSPFICDDDDDNLTYDAESVGRNGKFIRFQFKFILSNIKLETLC